MTQLLWVIPLGLVIGLAVGSLGAGGSILTVPALVYLLGQSPQAATTGSLIIVGLSSLVGALPHHRAGNVRWAKGAVFGLIGIGGSLLGSYLAAGIPPHVLLSAFSGLMFVVAVLMWRRQRRARAATVGDETSRWGPVVLTATGVGFLTGFFGVGGGFAVVPALVLALGLPMRAAVGTSLFVIALNTVTALAARAGGGLAVDWPLIGSFAVVATVGSLLGQKVTTRVSPKALAYAFVGLTAAVGAYMAVMNVPLLFR